MIHLIYPLNWVQGLVRKILNLTPTPPGPPSSLPLAIPMVYEAVCMDEAFRTLGGNAKLGAEIVAGGQLVQARRREAVEPDGGGTN